LSHPDAGKLSLVGAVIEIADAAKLRRFDALAEELGHGRNLLALLSTPGGNSEHLWSRQYELRRQGKDAAALCSEIQDLFASLIADFLAAGVAGRFTARGFLGIDEKPVPPRVFDDPQLRLRLYEDAIELPDGTTLRGMRVRIIPGAKDDRSEPGGLTPKPTSVAIASLRDVQKAVEARGPEATEAQLMRAVKEALPGTRIPRQWLRDAIRTAFPERRHRGRPRRPE
jgi:hypothetical protein